MPAGREPNDTFANTGGGAPQRIRIVPLLLVAAVIIGLGFLIAWGLNQFLRATFTPKVAASSEETPGPASAPMAGPVRETLPASPPPGDVRVVSAQPTLPPTASRSVDPELVPTSVAAGPVVQNLPSDELAAANTPRPSQPMTEPTISPSVAAEIARRAEGASAPAAAPAPRAFAALPAAPMPTAPPEVIDTNLRNPENALIKQEVLKRIDQMPDLSPENRDKLYARVERTAGMGRVATILFDTGDSRVRSTDIERLRTDLSSAAAQRLVEDPTVVLVVLGYADPTGSAELNKTISQARATAAVSAMRERLKLSNVMHSVAMGSSTLFGEGRDQLQKNRVVEVWAVMP